MEINKILQQNPSLLARASEEAENLRLAWLKEKELLTRLIASASLQLKPQDLKATEIKHMVEDNDAIYKKKLEVLILESDYRKKETEIAHLKEELNAVKMLARIKMTEWETTQR